MNYPMTYTIKPIEFEWIEKSSVDIYNLKTEDGRIKIIDTTSNKLFLQALKGVSNTTTIQVIERFNIVEGLQVKRSGKDAFIQVQFEDGQREDILEAWVFLNGRQIV